MNKTILKKIRRRIIFGLVGLTTIPAVVLGGLIGYLVPRLVFEDVLFLPVIFITGVLYGRVHSILLYDSLSKTVFEFYGFQLCDALDMTRSVVCVEGVGIVGVLGSLAGAYIVQQGTGLSIMCIVIGVWFIALMQIYILLLIFRTFENYIFSSQIPF